MTSKKTRKPDHCWLFRARWRATSLVLRIEADDLEYAYRKAENMVRRMFGGFMCLSIEAIKEVY